MRRILRRLEITADDFRHLAEGAEPGCGLIVPLAEWRARPGLLADWQGPLGLRLAPGDAVASIADELSRLALVALDFPGPGEGRGFTQARLLRTRFGFTGELRAVGAGVGRDRIWLMARCGFDAFELASPADLEAARAELAAAELPGAGAAAAQPDARLRLRQARFGF